MIAIVTTFLSIRTTQIQGLCGKFNYITSDDWSAPNGITEKKAGNFVGHYMSPSSCARQEDRPAVPDCSAIKVSSVQIISLHSRV